MKEMTREEVINELVAFELDGIDASYGNFEEGCKQLLLNGSTAYKTLANDELIYLANDMLDKQVIIVA